MSGTAERGLTTTRIEARGVDDMATLARLGAARYGFSDACEPHLFPLTENWTYRIAEAGHETAILRLYRPAGRPLEEIHSELTWMRALRKDEPSLVPDLIRMSDGGYVLEFVRDPLPPCFGVMFTCAAGREPPQDELAPWFPRLGEITARLHQHARTWQPPPWFTRPQWNLDTTLGDHPHWGSWTRGVVGSEECRQLARLADIVAGRLKEYGTRPDRFGLVHADLRLANILVDGDRLTVIDFDDCGQSWFMYDVGCALSFNQTRPDVDLLVDAWVTGYREVAPLAKEDEDAIPTFIMLRRLLEHAYLGLRPDTDLARECHEAGFSADSCAIAERYLRRFG